MSIQTVTLFVCGKSIKNSRERIKKQLKELWRYLEIAYAEEEQQPNKPDNFDARYTEEVSNTKERINQALDMEVSRTIPT